MCCSPRQLSNSGLSRRELVQSLCDWRVYPLLNMAAGRGKKANMAITGPHWLESWTLPQASGVHDNLEEDFWTAGELLQLTLLPSWLLDFLGCCLCPAWVGAADAWPTWDLGPTWLEASSLRRGPTLGCMPHWAPALGMLRPSAAQHTRSGLLLLSSPGVTEQTCLGGGQNTITKWIPPFSRGTPVLGSPCPPPGNYVSQFQRLVKRKGIIYSKSYTDLE